MTALLEVDHLSVVFPTEDGPVHAISDVSLQLERGEILGIVGESGCGKSVTAMSIPRLLPPNAQLTGSIRLAGRDVLALSPREMRALRGKQISVVFQEPMTSLNPSLTVGFQVAEVLRRHEGLRSRAARERTVELFELVGIPVPQRRVSEYPHQLSGGMRQRVMIAMAVACSPQILIADEPTTALDVTIQAGVLDVMRNLRDEFGTAILLITHDLGVIADIADRVVVMYGGRRVETASVHDLFAVPQHPYTVGLMGAIPRPQADPDAPRARLSEIPGRVPVLHSDLDACTFAPRCPRASAECVRHRPPLGQVRPEHRVACYHPGSGKRDTDDQESP